ncbi:MAG: hypothetical protein IPL49_19565 [Saprospirales bacterium]|nr:hypothetical protein [Saprospirales bacterium]
MSLILMCLLVGLSSNTLSAQGDKSFPENWVGNWTGELEIYNAQGLQQKIFMGMHIQPADSMGMYSWEITYGEGENKQVRPYYLQTVDAKTGHYQIDEGNSILLDAYWLGPVLVEIFSVEESLLTTMTEQVEDDVLSWQIVVGHLETTNVTGGIEIDGEEVPEVTSYLAPGLQRARLVRQK